MSVIKNYKIDVYNATYHHASRSLIVACKSQIQYSLENDYHPNIFANQKLIMQTFQSSVNFLLHLRQSIHMLYITSKVEFIIIIWAV